MSFYAMRYCVILLISHSLSGVEQHVQQLVPECMNEQERAFTTLSNKFKQLTQKKEHAAYSLQSVLVGESLMLLSELPPGLERQTKKELKREIGELLNQFIQGHGVNGLGPLRRTLLHELYLSYTLDISHPSLAQQLLDNGANPDLMDAYGKTATHYLQAIDQQRAQYLYLLRGALFVAFLFILMAHCAPIDYSIG